jgi:hypothetical protein
MTTIENEIIHLEDRLIRAIKTGNTTRPHELIHDDVVFNIPNGQTISRSMDIENYRSGKMTVYDIAISDRIIKSIVDVATVAVTVHLKARYGEQTIDGNYRYLRVWRLFDNSWKVIAGSAFQI